MQNTYLSNRRTILSALVVLTSLTGMSVASASQIWAKKLGVYPKCIACHSSQPGTKKTARLAAKQAYKAGGVIPGLQNYLKKLNAKNAKPELLSIDNQWYVQVGEVPLALPLIIKDNEQDSFIMQLLNPTATTAPKGYGFSKPYTVPTINLPAINFTWNPVLGQENQSYTAIFRAKETTNLGMANYSNVVKANIFVWPPRPQAADNVISQFSVDSASWANNKLTLSGRLAFKAGVPVAIQRLKLKTLRVNLTSNIGVIVGTPFLPRPNVDLVWSQIMPLTDVPCLVKAEYEGLYAARAVVSAPVDTCLP